MRLSSVDFPTLGRPTKLTNPDRNSAPPPGSRGSLVASRSWPSAGPLGPHSLSRPGGRSLTKRPYRRPARGPAGRGSPEAFDAHPHRHVDVVEPGDAVQRSRYEPGWVGQRRADDNVRL